VIGEADLQRNAEPNVFTTIAQLPSLQGSTGATTNTFSTSSGQQGLSSFSLRGLGTIRTLTLLDGQRVVPANITGVPDISLFPQLLVQRVDVVTGGASASYGSDAVGGVVNFITDKRFEGLQGQRPAGVTTYGDNEQFLVQVAGGKQLPERSPARAGQRRVRRGEGVPAGGFGEDAPGSRDWYTTATLVNRGVTNDGSPQYLYREHAQAYQYTKYGLISAGPLQGTAFDQNGNPFQFQYGSNGVPSKAANGAVTGCYSNGGFCVGGDLSGNVGIGTSLQSEIKRMNSYGRIAYDIDDNNEIYGTFNIAQVEANQPNPGGATTGLTMQCSNPYLPPRSWPPAPRNGITSFTFGTSNALLPNISVHPTRTQYRGVIGADGKFAAVGTDWHYDAYYTHGENTTNIHVDDIMLTRATTRPSRPPLVNGQIVCADRSPAPMAASRSTSSAAAPSDAALAYITPKNGPYQHSVQKQDVASINFSGEPIQGGPVRCRWPSAPSIAANLPRPRRPLRRRLGGFALHRRLSGRSDPQHAGNNWYAGNYHSAPANTASRKPTGSERAAGGLRTVRQGQPQRRRRWTDYSTSGTVYTWKVGGTWDTPIDGVRLRAVTSRDVRAPNLSELFAAPVTTTLPNFTIPSGPPPRANPRDLAR
jgi:iron complex outermembrane receptor protein